MCSLLYIKKSCMLTLFSSLIVILFYLFLVWHKINKYGNTFEHSCEDSSDVDFKSSLSSKLKTGCAQTGYIMACIIREQLESGMYDLHQLADLAESWGMKVGEPTIHKSSFWYPLTKIYKWKLRDIFDLEDLNANFRSDFHIDYDLIVSPQEILTDTRLGSDIVFIKWTHPNPKPLSTESCQKLAYPAAISCLYDDENMRKNAPQKDRIHVLCLTLGERVNIKKLLDEHPTLNKVAKENRKRGSKFKVIFSNWNGVRPTPGTFFFFDPDFHQRKYKHAHAILHSKKVRDAAQDLKVASNLRPNFLGVHIRLEKLTRNKKLSVSDINKCLNKMEFNIKKVMQDHLNFSVIAFTDSKPLGSQTCDRRCFSISKELKIEERLKSLGVIANPVLENSDKLSLMHLSGFVANVEQELLSQADYLILTGRGGFQVGITDRFKRHHNVTTTYAETQFVRVCRDY